MGADYSKDFNTGGSGFAELPDDVARNILSEVLQARLFNLGHIPPPAPRTPAHTFRTNADFWQVAKTGAFRETMSVHLPACAVSEWIPRSPGRAFWPDEKYLSNLPGADYDRYLDRHRLGWDPDRREFSPEGKAILVYGGIGTIRLGSRSVDGRRVHFLCATFSSHLNEGIPLILTDDLYSQVAPMLGRHGCLQADVTGSLTRPPQDLLEKLSFGREVPMHTFLQVADLRIIGQHQLELFATAAVPYSGASLRGLSRRASETAERQHISWTFCTFDPSRGPREPTLAAEWIVDYARRHSRGSPMILSDFDEQCSHFRNIEVALPLTQIVSGTLTSARLSAAFDNFGVRPELFAIDRAILGAREPQPMQNLKILFLAANPTTTSPLDLEEELRSLELELRGVKHRDHITLIARHAVRPDDLVRHVRAEQPAIIHFSGHGTTNGIVLRSDDGGYTEVTGANLHRFLSGRGVELVVLNACYTKPQADRITGAVKAVVGTLAAVDDEAARRFSVAFYRALGDGLSIREAFRDGGDAVALHGFKDVFCSSGELDRTPLTPNEE